MVYIPRLRSDMPHGLMCFYLIILRDEYSGELGAKRHRGQSREIGLHIREEIETQSGQRER